MRSSLGALLVLCLVAASTQAGDAVILRSTDYGQSWTQDPVECPENLNGVWVSAEDEILAVGDNGTILPNPTGAPNDWRAVSSPTSEDLMAVDGGWNWSYMQTAWAVGDNGTIIYTHNGGCSWQLMNSCTSPDLTDVFKGCGNVLACGSNGTIIRTDEVEDDWQFEQTPTSNKLYAIDLFDGGSPGLAAGQSGTMLRYTSSWQSIGSGTSDHLLGVTDFSYYAGDYAVVVGTRGTILRCSAQFNWELAASGTSSHLYSVSEALDGTVAVGNNGTILRSVDKGETWYTVSSPSSQNLRSVAFPHVPELGIIVG